MTTSEQATPGVTALGPRSWEQVRSWRKETRAALIAERMGQDHRERDTRRDRILATLESHIASFEPDSVIGFYWPFRGEVDLRPLVGGWIAAGGGGALPVVIEKAAPLIFRPWKPGMKLTKGVWNIPIPAEGAPITPDLLLVPLVGFDPEGYRLGYGGGYYDRTLAGLQPRPFTIGVGFELGRLETIHPQPHDIPLDEIVTEAGLQSGGG